MAVTLTTNWQPVASSTFAPGSGLSVTFWLDAKYSTQSTVNNNTTIQTRLNCVVNSGYGNGYNYSFSCSYAPTVSGSGLWTLSNETITSGGDTIKHNDDGTKTITLSATARINGIGMNLSFSGDAILPKIDRYATLTSAPDFNDEANPKITFTKNVATGATVYAGIFNSAGTTAYASYRSVGNATAIATGEYTFNLTSAERTALRNASTTNSLQVQFKLYTTISGTNFDGGSLTKTMSIINANPELSNPTFSEQNAKVSALLGSSGSTVVQNASTLRVGITATALKSASISKVVATHSGSTYTDTSSPYSFDIPIKANSITLTATDSRTNTGTLNITKTMLAYTPVAINTFSFKRQDETSSTIILNLSATYYQQTFGSTANAPIVKWKMGDGSWTTLTSSQYTIDNTNHKLTVSNLSLGAILNYQDEATFTIYIEDKLSTAQNSANVTIGIPTLEMGKDDVKVNGTFETTGNTTVGGTLKVGSFARNTTDTWMPVIRSGTLDYTKRNIWSSKTHTNWNTDQDFIPTMSVLSFWNGAYNSSNASNLTYAHQGTIECKPTSLYDNSTGTTGTVTLSQTSANFTYLEVFYRDNDNHYNSVKIYSPNGKVFWMNSGWINDNNNGGNMKLAYSTINGTSITKTRYIQGTIGGSGTSNNNAIYIVKVLGYK